MIGRSGEDDRVIAAWVAGDVTEAAALAEICAVIGRAGVLCGLVCREGVDEKAVAVVRSDASASERRWFERVSTVAGPRRAFHRREDDRWSNFLGADATDDATWLACEPVGEHDANGYSTLVVVGTDDAHRDEVLAALPGLARACAAILARERSTALVQRRMHALKNHLAAITANLEYAADLVSRETSSAGASTGAALGEAIGHAHEAARQMAGQLDELADLAGGRGHGGR